MAENAALNGETVEPKPADIIDECVAGVQARIQQALHVLTAEDDRNVLREKLRRVLDLEFGTASNEAPPVPLGSGYPVEDDLEMPAWMVRKVMAS
jgi:hypothetical protein